MPYRRNAYARNRAGLYSKRLTVMRPIFRTIRKYGRYKKWLPHKAKRWLGVRQVNTRSSVVPVKDF